jgi:hypothetical protein
MMKSQIGQGDLLVATDSYNLRGSAQRQLSQSLEVRLSVASHRQADSIIAAYLKGVVVEHEEVLDVRWYSWYVLVPVFRVAALPSNATTTIQNFWEICILIFT